MAMQKNPDVKNRNITVDAETQELLNSVQDHLTGVLGFRPSLKQAIRYMAKQALPEISK